MKLFNNLTVIYGRGSSFTEDYSQLGEVPSLVPTSVHVTALIATVADLVYGQTTCFISASSQKERCICGEKKKSSTEEVIEILARELKNILPPGPPPKMTERLVSLGQEYDNFKSTEML